MVYNGKVNIFTVLLVIIIVCVAFVIFIYKFFGSSTIDDTSGIEPLFVTLSDGYKPDVLELVLGPEYIKKSV